MVTVSAPKDSVRQDFPARAAAPITSQSISNSTNSSRHNGVFFSEDKQHKGRNGGWTGLRSLSVGIFLGVRSHDGVFLWAQDGMGSAN